LKATFNIRRLPSVALLVALVGALLLALRGRNAQVVALGADRDAQHIVAILQYLESDYPAAVASQDAGELAEQRSLSSEATATAERLPSVASFVSRIASIDARVRRGEDAAGVSTDCASLIDDLVAAEGIARAPSAPPDIDEGARLFAKTALLVTVRRGTGMASQPLRSNPGRRTSSQRRSCAT